RAPSARVEWRPRSPSCPQTVKVRRALVTNRAVPIRSHRPVKLALWLHATSAWRARTTLVHAMTVTQESPRTYEVRTYGCQMNVHDSERLSGLLEDAGYVPVAEGETADVVVFNTCAVRENADNRLY